MYKVIETILCPLSAADYASDKSFHVHAKIMHEFDSKIPACEYVSNCSSYVGLVYELDKHQEAVTFAERLAISEGHPFHYIVSPMREEICRMYDIVDDNYYLILSFINLKYPKYHPLMKNLTGEEMMRIKDKIRENNDAHQSFVI